MERREKAEDRKEGGCRGNTGDRKDRGQEAAFEERNVGGGRWNEMLRGRKKKKNCAAGCHVMWGGGEERDGGGEEDELRRVCVAYGREEGRGGVGRGNRAGVLR